MQRANTVPGLRRSPPCGTRTSGTGQSSTASTSRVTARAWAPAAEKAAPRTAVAATVVRAAVVTLSRTPGLRAYARHLVPARSSRRVKSAANTSQAAQARPRVMRERTSYPARSRPTDRVPVVSTAALAAGARCAHQATEGEGPGMGPMLGGPARVTGRARARGPKTCETRQAGRTTLWIDDSPS